MKKSIALFSTLLVLVMVILLMSIALKNSTNIKIATLKDRYLIQENLIISDIKLLLDNKVFSKLKSLPQKDQIDVLNLLFGIPLEFNDSVNNGKTTLKIEPINDRININFISSPEGKDYIEKIFTTLDISDPDYLIKHLLANIEDSDKYNDELKLYLKDSDINKGEIASKKRFDDIVQLYSKNSDDQEALKVDFEKYFSFFDDPAITYSRFADCTLDINYVDLTLLNVLVSIPSDIKALLQSPATVLHNFDELSLLQIENEEGLTPAEILKNHRFEFLVKNIKTTVNIESMNYKIEYAFNYNINNKKISNISMNRWIY